MHVAKAVANRREDAQTTATSAQSHRWVASNERQGFQEVACHPVQGKQFESRPIKRQRLHGLSMTSPWSRQPAADHSGSSGKPRPRGRSADDTHVIDSPANGAMAVFKTRPRERSAEQTPGSQQSGQGIQQHPTAGHDIPVSGGLPQKAPSSSAQRQDHLHASRDWVPRLWPVPGVPDGSD